MDMGRSLSSVFTPSGLGVCNARATDQDWQVTVTSEHATVTPASGVCPACKPPGSAGYVAADPEGHPYVARAAAAIASASSAGRESSGMWPASTSTTFVAFAAMRR